MISKEQVAKNISGKDKRRLKSKDFNAFSTPYRKLGMLLTGEHGYHKSNISYFNEAFPNAKLDFNPFAGAEGKKLAVLLYGEVRAAFIAKIWNDTYSLPYLSGWGRRSFRIPVCENHLKNNIDKCKQLYILNQFGFADMTLEEQVQYSAYFDSGVNAYLFAIALEKNQEDFNHLITDILQGEDEIGGVSSAIIKALLLTSHQENWEKVSQLLLAAQRQEGLRQVILESLDETTREAFIYITEKIITHDLVRFSSVVRAVDTWFGFGWEAPKSKTIKRVLELALLCLENPDRIEEHLKSKDNLERYVGFWALGFENVLTANAKAFDQVYNHPDKEHKLTALYFISQTQMTQSDVPDHLEHMLGNDVELDYWLLRVVPKLHVSNTLFQKIERIAEGLPKEGKRVKGQIFSWFEYTVTPDFFYDFLIRAASESQLLALGRDLSAVPSTLREQLMRTLFPKHFQYSWSYRTYTVQKIPDLTLAPTDPKRQIIRQAITDRNNSVMATGIQLFHSLNLLDEDYELLESILVRSHKDLRKNSIQLLLKQNERGVCNSTRNLLLSAHVSQRLAGLEMLSELEDKNRLTEFVQKEIADFKERPSLSKNEEVLLERFSPKSTTFSFSNGYGVIDFDNLSPIIEPQLKFEKKGNVLTRVFSSDPFLFKDLVNTPKISLQINKLIDLYTQHKDFEYQFEDYQGELSTILLADSIIPLRRTSDPLKGEEILQNLPLGNVWAAWYQESKLNDFELLYALHYTTHFPYPFGQNTSLETFVKHYVPNIEGLKLVSNRFYNNINSKVRTILGYLWEVYVDVQTMLNFRVDMLEDMIARFPQNLKRIKFRNESYFLPQETYWMDQFFGFNLADQNLNWSEGDSTLQKRYWDLKIYLLFQKLGYPDVIRSPKKIKALKIDQNRDASGPPIALTVKLFLAGKIQEDDLLFQALQTPDLMELLDGGWNYRTKEFKDIGFSVPGFEKLKANLLSLELERGDLSTEASPYIRHIKKIEGTSYFFRILERMGTENFDRGYYYYVEGKKSNFSQLLRISRPGDAENVEDFKTRIDEAGLSKKRLIEVACYAPQWADWIGNYLKLEQLDSAVWWFHAHCSDYMNADKETLVSRYSNLDKSDFAKGAIDLDWFNRVYGDLGKTNWKLLHQASKYISSGNGHRQVKLYSSVILGEVKITETLQRISEKRDKDYVRALGLVPLSKTIPQKDLLKRYQLLQEFLKESRQFGAQRQESEKTAVEIGLDNLARNAGYEDSVRFSWAMEAKTTSEIMRNAELHLDNLKFNLQIDEKGKAHLKVEKDGKPQKTIPPKYRKNKELEKLKVSKADLNKQYSRTRLSLEQAMVRETSFSLKELKRIMQHPVVKAMLLKLVLTEKETQRSGFYRDGKIIDISGSDLALKDTAEILIAHPSHLFSSVSWDLYQHYLFEHKIQQPFKQVFRELYVITSDEREQGWRSERYQGHQIQPNKTVALLRARGWSVSREEGLQKVYHKLGFVATMYAMADWFSPADVEAPTLEYVCFHSLKDYKPVPLGSIPPVVFSEVMRDVDLVVSVAHVGGVDPEASHSTMEMRAALAKESAMLFKLKNVLVKDRHIIIKGKLGDYSIHLGSGMIQKNGLHLSIIPVHSQHRGRLFLPFVDDDPKSAEIISKMKMLSEDHKIQDPTVLAQINKN
ncbi:MAG: hypothetical protein COA80_06290 [Leeuwenhoekiella sp.]|nr:MAG: hypothetical protein COA80_06290 [Leeuwenhoekiella sp.]